MFPNMALRYTHINHQGLLNLKFNMIYDVLKLYLGILDRFPFLSYTVVPFG